MIIMIIIYIGIAKAYINYLKHDGKRIYSEQNTGMWWQNTEKSLPCGSKLLSIILYSDATNVDALGKKTSILFICQSVTLRIGDVINQMQNNY